MTFNHKHVVIVIVISVTVALIGVACALINYLTSWFQDIQLPIVDVDSNDSKVVDKTDESNKTTVPTTLNIKYVSSNGHVDTNFANNFSVVSDVSSVNVQFPFGSSIATEFSPSNYVQAWSRDVDIGTVRIVSLKNTTEYSVDLPYMIVFTNTGDYVTAYVFGDSPNPVDYSLSDAWIATTNTPTPTVTITDAS